MGDEVVSEEKIKLVESDAEWGSLDRVPVNSGQSRLADATGRVSFGHEHEHRPSDISLVGTIVADKYEIVSMVGQGAMGALYKARHVEIGREVAVKVIHDRPSTNPAQFARFKQEARLAASLSHPNLCETYDYGELPDGRGYQIMGFINGKSLAEHLKTSGVFAPERAIKLMIQICDGLKHAHNKNLVHRDLKPSNIMLSDESGVDFVKIVDFGIAKMVSPGDLPQSQSLTQTGEVFGSPLYMSPEQCQGYPLDARTDIYSLGCVLYELLTGSVPFKGDNAVQTILKHLNEKPQSFDVVRPDLSFDKRLEDIVHKCLQKNADHRYQTAEELQRALREVVPSDCPNAEAVAIASAALATASAASASESAALSNKRRIMMQVIPIVVALSFLAFIVYMLAATHPDASVKGATVLPGLPESKTPEKPYKTYVDPASGNPEVDVLYARIGKGQDSRRDEGTSHAVVGDIKVRVTRDHDNAVLFLSGYAPILWHIQTDPGVRLKQVYLLGMNPQKVEGLSSEVPIVSSSEYTEDGKTWDELTDDAARLKQHPMNVPAFSFLSSDKVIDSQAFKELQNLVQARTGAKIRNFEYWDGATNIKL